MLWLDLFFIFLITWTFNNSVQYFVIIHNYFDNDGPQLMNCT